jgi:hypothetical protein
LLLSAHYVGKMMAFCSMTVCMDVPWKMYSLLEQGAALEALLCDSILQIVSL